MFFGWEFGNSASAGLGLKALTSPNFSRWELASRPLNKTSRLPGGPQPGLSALLREACSWRGAAFPGLGLGPCPHFNDRLEPSAFTDWESYMLAWGFVVINSLCRHRSWAVSTSALGSELNSPCAVINGQNTPPVYYYRALRVVWPCAESIKNITSVLKTLCPERLLSICR